VGFYHTPGYAGAKDVAVAGGYAYVADGDAGLRVVDVSSPANPTEVSFYDTLGYANGVAVAGDYAYVAAYGGLWVMDISTPANPTESGFCDTGGVGVAVAGGYAYIVENTGSHPGSDGWLRVVDVSTPTSPTEVGFYDTPGWAEGVAVARGYAYVADGDGGLRVLDVSTPSNPTEVGFYDTQGWAEGVAVAGDYAYVAAGWEGLLVLRYTGYSISGHVRDSSDNPISDVTVSANAGSSATTDANGDYFITGVTTGTYTLTPSKSGYTFIPASRTASVPSNATGQNFVILPDPVSITLPQSGTVSLPTILIYTDTQGLTTTLRFPAGAVTETTTLILTPTLAQGGAGYAFAGHAFEIGTFRDGHPLSGLTFSKPVTVTIHYSDQDVRVVSDESQLALWWWTGGGWEDAANTCDPPSAYNRDLANRVLSVPICHLSLFGLFGPTHQMYLPLILRHH